MERKNSADTSDAVSNATSSSNDIESYSITYFSEEQFSLLQQLRDTLIDKNDIDHAFEELERLDNCFQVILNI